VPSSDATHWSTILDAARGEREARDRFARRYEGVVRSYLAARWRGTPLVSDVDDATQEVFVDCFRDAGALERLDPARAPSFRAFLRGVVRNVALRTERNRARQKGRPGAAPFEADRLPADDDGLSTVFDRAWARSLLALAAERQKDLAREQGDEALRRVELLELRFDDGLPIRDIAKQWGVDTTRLHREYARARREFGRALQAVVAEHHPGSREEVRAECLCLLELFG